MVRFKGVTFAFAAFAGLVVFSIASSSYGQAPVASTWDGGGADDFWLTPANWNADTAPLATNSLAFAGAVRVTPNNNFTAGTTFSGITFSGGASAFTLSGNAITLGGNTLGNLVSAGTFGGLTVNGVTNSSANLQTVNLGLTLAAGNHTFSGGSTAPATLALNPGGGLLRNTGGIAVFIPSTGGITTTTITKTNGIIGAWATVGTNATTVNDWATVDNTGKIVALPASGYTDIAGGGTIASDGTKNYRIPTAGATITMASAGTTNANTMELSAGTAQTIDIGAGNILRLGASGGVLRAGTSTAALTIQNGTLTAGGTVDGAPGELIFNTGGNSNNTGTLTISSTITDNAGGAVTVVKTGFSAMQISGTNSYTGGTIISEGRLNPGNGNSLGTGPITIMGTGQLFTGATFANSMFISGVGTTENNGNGAIRLDGGGVLNGTITLIGNARIAHRSNSGVATINGQITGPYSLEIGGDNNANAGAGTTPTMLTNPLNSWTGDTRISESITLRLGANEVIPNGAGFGNVVMNSNNGTGSTFSTVLDLNGFNETINGLSRAGNATALTNCKIENDAVNTTATLTIGDNNATSTFDGQIRNNLGTGGTLGVVKIGTGTLTLSGASNAYTGGTLVSGGTLKVGNVSALGSGNVGTNTGGTLDLNGLSISAAGLNGNGGTINSSTAGTITLTLNGSGISSYGGSVQNGTATVAVTKSGTGTQTLSGANTYTGATTISGGTLAVNGSLFATGAVAVNSGATLGGTGSVGNVTMAAGSNISPATTSVGTLTMNSLTVNGGSFTLDVGGSTDLVNVTGTATFTSGQSSIFSPVFSGGTPATGNYLVLQAGNLVSAGHTFNTSFPGGTRFVSNVVVTSGLNGTIMFNLSGGSKSIVWTGATNSTWDIADLNNSGLGTQNWKDANTSAVEKYFNLDTVTFDDTTSNRTVQLDVPVQPTAITVDTTAGYTVQGAGSITGLTGITKKGTGTLTFGVTGASNFTGTTAVQNGTLTLGPGAVLSPTSAMILGDAVANTSGILDVGGNNVTVKNLAVAGTGLSNAVTNNGASGATLSISANSTFTGNITNGTSPLALTTRGGATVTIAGTDTYSGATSVQEGATLRLGSSGALPAGASVVLGEATGNTNGTLDLGGFSVTLNGLSTAGTGTANIIGNSSTTSDSMLTVNAVSPVTFAGSIRDVLGSGTRNVGLTLSSGTLLLTGTSTFSGPTNVATGATLKVGAAAIGTAITTPLGSTTASATNIVTVNSGATLDISGPGTSTSLNFGQKQFFIAGTGVGGVGAIVNDGTTPATGGLNQQNAFQKITLTADATINTTGDSTATNTPGRIDIRAGQVGGVNVAKLDLAGFTLTKAGTSYFGIVNTDVTPGNIVVNSGIFQIEAASNVPGGAGSGTITYNDGTYASFFTNTGDVSRPIVINGNVNMGTAANSNSPIASPITLNGALTVVPRNLSGTGTLILSGSITETGGSRSITKANNNNAVSTLVLSGTNSFTGGLTIGGGVVQLGSTSALNASVPNAVLFNGSVATDVLRLAGNSVTISSLTGGSANPAVENASATPATLTISDTGSDSFAGVVRDGTGGGVLSFVKSGAGTQILSGNSSYTGSTTINGGTVQIGAFGTTGSLSGTSSVSGSGTLSVARSDNLTLAAPISGSVKLVQQGGGTLTLTGTSTSTGATDINNGSLLVNGALASAGAVNVHSSSILGGAGDGVTTGKVGNVTMDFGSSIRPGASAISPIGKLTMNSLIVNGGDFAMDIASLASRDTVAVTGTANFTAFNTSSFTPSFTAVPQAGTYPLLTAGNLIINASHTINLTPPSSTTRFTFGLVKTTGLNGSIALSVSGSTKSIVWTGAQSLIWDVGATSPQNWKELPSTVERYFDLDSITFDDTSNVSKHNVQLSVDVTPSAITFNNNTDYTISGSGKITGTTGITKTGTGKVTLVNGSNDYSGGTNIQDGTLVLGSSSALSPSTTLTLGGGTTSGTLDLGSISPTLAGLASGGTGTNNAIGSGGTSQNLTVTISGGNSTFVGAIKDNVGTGTSNTVGLTLNGGTLRIDGNNTYSGATIINTGATLRIGNGGATGSLSAVTTISDNGTLDFDRSGTLTVSQGITGSGGLEKHGTGTLILTGANGYSTTLIAAGKLQIDNGGTTGTLGTGAVTNNGTLTFNRGDLPPAPVTVANVISGTGDVEKLGGSILTLSGANTYTGTTTISAGVLRVTSSGSLGTVPGGPVIVASGATLDLNGASNVINLGQKEIRIQGSGVGNITGTGALGALSSTSTATQNNAFQRVVLTGDASIGNPGVPNGQGRFDVRAGQTNNQNTAFLDLAGHTLTKIGTNQISLVATDVTPGDIVVQSTNAGAGETRNLLALETSTTILAANKPDNSPYTITYNDHTTMGTFGDNGTITRQIVYTGDVLTYNGGGTTSTVAAPISLSAPSSIMRIGVPETSATLGTGDYVLTGTISGPGSVIKENSTVARFSGNNTYTGSTTVSLGTLAIGAANRMPDSSPLILSDGTFSTAGFDEKMATLAVTSSGIIDLGTTGASLLQFNNSSGVSWPGSLTISNWSQGLDRLFVGSDASGLTAAQLSAITFTGFSTGAAILSTGEIYPVGAPPVFLHGDWNRDGSITTADISTMLTALTDLTQYEANFNVLTAQELASIGDFNSSGTVTNLDIQGELDLVAGSGAGSVAGVPEPASIGLGALAAIGWAVIGRRRIGARRKM